MKKTYFAPNTTIFKVSLRHMITASDPATQLKSNQTIDLSGVEEGGGTGTVLNSRRGGSFWDEE